MSYISTFFRNRWCSTIYCSIFTIGDNNIITPKNSSISSFTICASLTIDSSLSCPFSKNNENSNQISCSLKRVYRFEKNVLFEKSLAFNLRVVIAGNDDLLYIGRVVIRYKIVGIRNIVSKVPIILRTCVSERNSIIDYLMKSSYKIFLYLDRKIEPHSYLPCF